MKKRSILLFFLFLLITINWSWGGKKQTKIEFKWSVFKKVSDDKYESISINSNETHKQGDEFKFYLKPISNVYLYLFAFDSDKELIPLFPENPDFFKDKYKMDEAYFIPEDDVWFEITGNGIEKFYLLASYERLKRIESLTKDYLKLEKDNKTAQKFFETKQELLDEIDRSRVEYSQFKVYAEKPTSIAGVSRSLESKVKHLAINVEAEKFYGKIIRLEH